MGEAAMNGNNVVLTGIPRSGTTLACFLLNKLPDTVALIEPMDVSEFPGFLRNGTLIDNIRSFFSKTRKSILAGEAVPCKLVKGGLTDNTIGDKRNDHGMRILAEEYGNIRIDKKLSDDFMLAVKHPAAFTALLKMLSQHFRCYAVVRNPLAILGSWNSVDIAVNDGHSPAAEALDKNLRNSLSKINDKMDRQLNLLSWYFEQYDEYLSLTDVIKYEDIISSGGGSLRSITPKASLMNERLESKNKSDDYDQCLMRFLGEKLLSSKGAFWSFYSKDEVRELMRKE